MTRTKPGNDHDLSRTCVRLDSLSILSRQSDLRTYVGRIAAILVLCLTIGVGNAWGASPETTSFASATSITGNGWSQTSTTTCGGNANSNSVYWLWSDINSRALVISNSTQYSGKTISAISVEYYCNGSGSGTMSFTVGGSAFASGKTVSGGKSSSHNTVSFSGSGTGTIVMTVGSVTNTDKRFCLCAITVTYSDGCSNNVTISKGTQTNCTFTLSKSGAQASCSGVSTTVTVSPTSGYGNPTVTQTGASAAPTITGSSNTYTVAYGANTTGTSTINVSCSANTYTITLNKDLTPTTAGTASITATYNANTNLTSAITKPTKTGWTFDGYYTAKNGGGTQIIDASGNVIASVSGYTDASKNWKYVGNITLYAKWTCTVTWSVNGLTNVYSTQTVTYNSSGSKVASIPGPPSPASYCGDKFVGWTTESSVSQDNDTGLGLFTTVSGSPDIKSIGDITFYAVFADYDE